ncbi:hypothetical protein AS4_27850 [Acinetobacter guillouiae]|uniref:hypothetical protein n=1 Tax=Acinetobacter guillouiae TaxID=106649 RepID=UPI0004EF61F2|nr:hypothetical protein [Acinetobacter guillouiae]BAP37725.1 hypothetical protein AS4_27850 [Acinetobacter guillouiae]
MKYFKDKDGSVYAFEDDGSQDEFITPTMKKMTNSQIDRHLNPQKYLNDEEKNLIYLQSLRPLTRRQFMLALVENDLDEAVETAIGNIQDAKQRKQMSIEYNDAQTFERFSASIMTMATLINLDEESLNSMWEKALTL